MLEDNLNGPDKLLQDPANQYFAAKPAEDAANIILGKADTFYQRLNTNKYLDKLHKMWRFYYGIFSETGGEHEISFTGQDGELVVLPVNHFRNIGLNIYNMITTNRPVMEARAVNNDYKSLSQTYLANGILDYYMREKGLEANLKRAVEMSIVLGAGFIKMEWNATAGEAYDADPETGTVQHEGELEFSTISPFDVVVDGTREKWDNEWVLVRSYQNKYNLIAKYPELAEKILGLKSVADYNPKFYSPSIWSNDATDDVPVYEFYHKRTEAMPNGRYLLFLDKDIILLDTPMPYRVIPIFRVAPSDILGTPYGYTPLFDIFPIQEGINSLYSTIMTNQNAFGVQSLWSPKDNDLSMASLENGLNLIESKVKPEAIQFTETPAEVFKFLELLVSSAETISGVNSVARGNPQASLESGTALALIQAMAIQFISGLQQSYIMMVESVGTALIQNLKDFATTPKVAALVGKNNRTYLKEFTGEQLSSINRVVVDVGNPLSRTIAGRVQMADNLLQYQLIKQPQQYFQVLNTGRLDVMFEGEMHQLLLVKNENEKLMDGKPVRALMFDDHRLHVQEHQSVLSDPDLRDNDELTELVLAHIQEHYDLMVNANPIMLELSGQAPLQSLQQMQQQGQVPPGAEGSNAQVLAPEEAPVVPGQEAELPGEAPNSLPSLPEVPAEALPNPELQAQTLNNIK